VGGDALTLSGTTAVVGIIGYPVGHSLSPAIHNAAFAALGLDWVYVPLPVLPDEVGAAVQGLRALGLRGANVTAPHKEAVVPHLDRLGGDAEVLQAVNTVAVRNGALVGFNTDVEGVRAAAYEVCGESLRGAPGLLFGAGGAARAAALALARMGVRLTVVNRTAAAAERLSALISAAVPGSACRWVPIESLDGELVAAQVLVVNATSLGLAGAGKVPAPLADTLSASHVVFDVVYSDGGTLFLKEARARGATTVDGREMLLHQAAAAFEVWTGEPAPLRVMREALDGR
jgi:shikimate dehydrogenase